MNRLVKFEIDELYGIKNYSIKIDDNKVILVGENGSGKTTIFKIMYYTLSCDWDALCRFVFKCIRLFFSNGEIIVVESEMLQNIFTINDIDRVSYYIDGRRSRRTYSESLINELINLKESITESSEEELKKMNIRGMYPDKYIQSLIEEKVVTELYLLTKKIRENFNATILYLPTYRRIEEQLKNIFPNVDREEWAKRRKYGRSDRAIELVEFGMEDVESAVKAYKENLNEFSRAHQNKLTLGYLGEIIGEKYEQVGIESINSLSEQQISDILQRIDITILSEKQKQEIRQILLRVRNETGFNNVKDKIVCHYFLKLIDLDKSLSEEEAALLKFIDKCNKYLVNNILIYDNIDFSCKIYNRVKSFSENRKQETLKEIHFQDMSSGEKQIVSLFSHLNLTQKKNLFVFIDEPELSLSVDWQKMFLVDVLDSVSCVGLIATTHSPFIFDNELEKYVHGINEFCVRE